MPIYAYRCEACGFTKDVLQKLSDAPLTECPSCAKSAFKKQLTAAGFQLKGTGWYATDFRNNGGTSAPASTSTAAAEPSCPAADACGASCAANAGSTTSAA